MFVLLALFFLTIFASMVTHDLTHPSSTSTPSGWSYIGSSNGVELYNKAVFVNNKTLLGVKGTATVDVPIKSILSTFFDISRSTSWIQDLYSVTETNLNKRTLAGRLRQRYRVAGGLVVKDREFVIDRTVKISKRTRNVLVDYKSVPLGTSEDLKICKNCVRARTPGTKWSFRRVESGTTEVEVEAVVDPGGGLPKVLVDLIQRKWPRNSIVRLAKEAKSKKIKGGGRWEDW